MKYIELQKYGEYSVIVRQDDNGNLIAINPFVVAYNAEQHNGEVTGWGYGHYFDDLFGATDYARSRAAGRLQYLRLEEIASKAIDGLIEDDEESAYEYLANEIELDSDEAEYFGLNAELLDSYK